MEMPFSKHALCQTHCKYVSQFTDCIFPNRKVNMQSFPGQIFWFSKYLCKYLHSLFRRAPKICWSERWLHLLLVVRWLITWGQALSSMCNSIVLVCAHYCANQYSIMRLNQYSQAPSPSVQGALCKVQESTTQNLGHLEMRVSRKFPSCLPLLSHGGKVQRPLWKVGSAWQEISLTRKIPETLTISRSLPWGPAHIRSVCRGSQILSILYNFMPYKLILPSPMVQFVTSTVQYVDPYSEAYFNAYFNAYFRVFLSKIPSSYLKTFDLILYKRSSSLKITTCIQTIFKCHWLKNPNGPCKVETLSSAL